MAEQKFVWIVAHSDRSDPEGTPVVFTDRAKAFAAAGEIVKAMASSEIESFEFAPDDPNRAKLDEMLGLVGQGKSEDAVEVWAEYQADTNAESSLSVIEAIFVK